MKTAKVQFEFGIARLFEAASNGDDNAAQSLDAIEKILYPERDKLTVGAQRGMAIRYRITIITPWVQAAVREYEASTDVGKARIAIEREASCYEKDNAPFREAYEYVLEHWKPSTEARSLGVKLYLSQCANDDLHFEEAELFRNLREAEKIPLQSIGPEEWRNRKRGWSRDNKTDNRADENQQEPT